MLASVGRFREAVVAAEKGRSLDPLSQILNLNLGTMQLYVGDYSAADSTLRATIRMDPANPSSHWTYSNLLTVRKDYPAAIAQLDTAMTFTDNKMNVAKLLAYRAIAQARAGDTIAARAVLRETKLNPRRNEFGYEISLLHLALSENDSAIAWVRIFLGQPFSDPFFLRVPFFEPIRNDPRFEAALQHALQ